MNRIAVILRGHIRSWNIIHKRVFEFYESLAYNVDYYFTTYKVDNFDYTKTKKSFEGKNLVKFLLVPTENRVGNENMIYNSWYGPAYLVYRILPYMRKRCKDYAYDAVFDSRPDVLPKLKHNLTPLRPEKNTLHTSGIELHKSYITKKYELAISDHFFMYDFETCQRLADRHIYPCPNGNQIEHRMWLEQNRINLSVIDWVEAYITRPNVDKLINTDLSEIGKCYELFNEWGNYTDSEKIEYCKKYEIALQDYLDTDTYHCQIKSIGNV